MKGVILAAGRGKRLLPITKVIDKTILPVYDKPIIFYAIETLVNAGIKEILIVVNSFNRGMIHELVGDGESFGIEINYKTKNHDLGMPFSILQAKEFAKKDSIMVVPGDNLFFDDFQREVKEFKEGAMAFLRHVEDLTRFGVAKFEGEKLIDIVEKPKYPPSEWAVIAPYIFDSNVFGLIKKLKPSQRGELEVVELMKMYLVHEKLNLIGKDSYWSDIGTFTSLADTSFKVKEMMIK